MVKFYRLLAISLILMLGIPQQASAQFSTGEKVGIGVAVTAVVGLIGFGLYSCLKEETDTQVLQKTQSLCSSAHTHHTHTEIAYTPALQLLEAQEATADLKNLIYASGCGNRYPISSYMCSLDSVLTDIKYYIDSLRSCHATMIQRKLRLLNAQHNKSMNPQERAYLLEEFDAQLAHVYELDALLLTSQHKYALLKQKIAAFPEYAQECLFARLDKLENKLSALEMRPQIHTVYVHGHWNNDHRIDHLENRIDRIASNCYQR
jgi:tetrahydromethanopterin S-methyltransferase subunit G